MTQPGKVYVAPLRTDAWPAKEWKDLGYTTEVGVAAWADDTVEISVPARTALERMGRAFKVATLSFRQMADSLRLPGFLFYAPKRERSEHIRCLRQAYRQKRGRRRFR